MRLLAEALWLSNPGPERGFPADGGGIGVDRNDLASHPARSSLRSVGNGGRQALVGAAGPAEGRKPTARNAFVAQIASAQHQRTATGKLQRGEVRKQART